MLSSWHRQRLEIVIIVIRDREEYFPSILELPAEAILVLQEGQRKYYNLAWLDTAGYSSEEYDSIPFLSPLHPDHVEWIDEAYHQFASGSLHTGGDMVIDPQRKYPMGG